MTQREKVEKALIEEKCISVHELQERLGIKNVSAYISDLRKAGLNIVAGYHTNLWDKGVYMLVDNDSEADAMSVKYPRQDNKKLWRIWSCMRQRCNYPKADSYKHYGAKGIKVCHEWDVSFQTFAEWAINNGYKDGLSIDRIDSSKGYEPANCRWATAKEQANNRSTNHPLTFKGITMNMSEWAEELDMPDYIIGKRIRAGWSVEKTLTTPVREKKPNGYYKKEV